MSKNEDSRGWFKGLFARKSGSEVFGQEVTAPVDLPAEVTPVNLAMSEPAPQLKDSPKEIMVADLSKRAVSANEVAQPKVAELVPTESEKEFENPLEVLKKKLHYEPANFDTTKQTLSVGDKTYSNCEEMDVAGIQSKKYSAVDQDGRRVIIKIRNKSFEQDVTKLLAQVENKWGEPESLVYLQIDEAVLGLMSECEIGKNARPNLLACGKLPDGNSLIVEELVEGSESVDCIYNLRYDFVSSYKECGVGDTDEQARLEKEADCLKAALLLMFRDSLDTVRAMFETNVFSKDLKIGDYIIKEQPLKKLETPKKLEQEWRGVFVDWGVADVRVDKASRPKAEQKDLFLDSMQRFLEGRIKGIIGTFFKQSPRFPNREDVDAVRDPNKKIRMLKLIETFAEIREPLDSLSSLVDREVTEPQDNFLDQGKAIFAKLNLVAEKLGLETRFEFPL